MKRITLLLTIGATACFSDISGPTSSSGTDGSSDTGSSGSSGSSDTGSSGESTGGSTGSTASVPYAPCLNDLDCDNGLLCVNTDGIKEGIDPRGFCSVPCNLTSECPIPDTGSATITCTYYGSSRMCMLTCAGGLTCPVDLECLDVVYPIPGIPDATLMMVCI